MLALQRIFYMQLFVDIKRYEYPVLLFLVLHLSKRQKYFYRNSKSWAKDGRRKPLPSFKAGLRRVAIVVKQLFWSTISHWMLPAWIQYCLCMHCRFSAVVVLCKKFLTQAKSKHYTLTGGFSIDNCLWTFSQHVDSGFSSNSLTVFIM